MEIPLCFRNSWGCILCHGGGNFRNNYGRCNDDGCSDEAVSVSMQEVPFSLRARNDTIGVGFSSSGSTCPSGFVSTFGTTVRSAGRGRRRGRRGVHTAPSKRHVTSFFSGETRTLM